MDRMKEFLSVVKYTSIPQMPFKKPNFYIEVNKIEIELTSILDQLSKLTSYESFKAQPLIKQSTELLRRYKNIDLDQNVSRDYLLVNQNMMNMIKTRYLQFTLRLNKISRSLSKHNMKSNLNDEINKSTNATNEETTHQSSILKQKQSVYFQKPLIDEPVEDTLQERRRIVNSITEIGQIVEDISIHVNLQEEQLRRIDDVVLTADGWNKKALNELNYIWDMVRSGRYFMIKFTVFWTIIILIFWLVKR